MANCPNCSIPLQTVREREGIYFHCNQCYGRAATIQQIRRTVGDRFVSGFVRLMNTTRQPSQKSCPFCLSPMKTFQLLQPPLMLDSCRACVMIWFDADKFEQLPEGAVDTPEDAWARSLEAEAKWKIEQQQRAQGVSGDPPDEWWKWIPAFVGLPVKFDSPEISQRPWATWSLSALITLISFYAFFDLRAAVETFGMIPAEAWRYGGATLITSFFLHAGLWHLFGNLYFFLLFGGEVEEYLGRWRFLLLIFLSTIFGDLLHILGNLHSMIPSIGASGGISGVLVFYALQFPKGTLAFFSWRFGWIHVPAWGAFIIWLLLQLIGVYLQKAGLSHVSSMAHLGGVLMGFVLWLLWRKFPAKKGEAPAENDP
jgi:membrane associated rhomboid family serine protease